MTQASTPTGLGDTPALMRLHNLTVSYRGHPAVHHLSGAFASGRMTAVVGPNGAGKSTLLAALGGSLRSFEGRIEQPASLRRAYLPQVSSWMGELSAGQAQRVLFARVLLQDAELILLDEPFNAIDSRTTADLLALLHRWQREQRTVIAVLHDLEQVREHFEEALLLAREGVAWGPTADVLRAENLFKARQMAQAWDDQAPICKVAA